MIRKTLIILSMTALASSLAWAGEDSSLTVEGQEIKIRAEALVHAENLDKVYSGWVFRTDETQALQIDDFDNPAFVFVDEGLDLFSKVDGSETKTCTGCHTNLADFAGLRASLQKVVDGKLVSMEDLVSGCCTKRMGADPWKWSGTSITAVTALIGLQSRGMKNIRAIPYKEGGEDFRALELYLASRGNGLPVETPFVRN